jgi:hypothetical protein
MQTGIVNYIGADSMPTKKPPRYFVGDIPHTPGPWLAECTNDDRDDGADEITANGVVIARVEGNDEIRQRMNKGEIEPIGSNFGADTLDEIDANACLMSAAPELLFVLDRILKAHESDNNGIVMGEATLCNHFVMMARDAIAKARGLAHA